MAWLMNPELIAARAAHDKAWAEYQRQLRIIDEEMARRRLEAFQPVREANERIGAALTLDRALADG